MANKDIQFDVRLKSTERQMQFNRDFALTSDQNSVRIIFNIKDLQENELIGATAGILISMQDGSFYKVPTDEIVKEGTSYKYVLKRNEGKHPGDVRTQLLVQFSDDVTLSSRLCEFRIDTALDNIVATEVMIHDWTTLLKEANQYIDDFVENERLSAEEGRVSAEVIRSDNENERASAEETRVEQEQFRVDAESLRMEQFREMQVTQNLDDGKSYKTTLEISGGMPRLKLEEV